MVGWYVRTPRVGKVDGKQPDERNGYPSLGLIQTLVLVPVIFVQALHDGDHNVTAEHADGSGDQEGLTTELVEQEHCRQGEDNLENTGDTGGQEGLFGGGETER